MPAELVGAGLAGATALDARGEVVRGDRGVGGGDRGAQDGDPGDPRARPRSVRRRAWGPSRRAPGLAGRAEPADPAAGFLLRAGLVQGDEADHHLLLGALLHVGLVQRGHGAADLEGPARARDIASGSDSRRRSAGRGRCGRAGRRGGGSGRARGGPARTCRGGRRCSRRAPACARGHCGAPRWSGRARPRSDPFGRRRGVRPVPTQARDVGAEGEPGRDPA